MALEPMEKEAQVNYIARAMHAMIEEVLDATDRLKIAVSKWDEAHPAKGEEDDTNETDETDDPTA